ncbi:hypothetical protein WR25_04335 [Diploscapter pachys]|uniref:BZIP domain-containing protein n=1 Tax=Diploscapter pachys TaxID=2018661 RepID=A0A2A2L9K4_9BILA|nr:hypothetical protein WR25_04335 [Diploscapter pachys]
MNQNLSYAYSTDPRGNSGQAQQIQGLSFHPSTYQSSTYTTSSTAPFHSSSSAGFIPNNLAAQNRQQQSLRVGGIEDGNDKRIVSMLDQYFEQSTPSTSNWNTHSGSSSNQLAQQQQPLSYSASSLIPTLTKNVKTLSPDKAEKERLKRARQAEAARMRYHRLSADEKRELNLKRTLAQKRKRQREKEIEELESILRETNDIQAPVIPSRAVAAVAASSVGGGGGVSVGTGFAPTTTQITTTARPQAVHIVHHQAQTAQQQQPITNDSLQRSIGSILTLQEDPDITEQLREKRMRAKWAEAARSRYARMTPDERRNHNNRRRMRQMQNALNAIKDPSKADAASLALLQAAGATTGDPVKDEQLVRDHIKSQNAKKAEAARLRYHRMSDDEKRVYNQRRTEAFRRRRMEEEMLLAMPIGRINGEALDRAQQIVVRNAKREEAARLRYQRMTPEQRKASIAKRYTPKRKRGDDGAGPSSAQSLGGPQQGNLGTINLGSTSATAANNILTTIGSIQTMQGVKKGQNGEEDSDVLSTIERDVLRRTQQAHQQLLRNQRNGTAAQVLAAQLTRNGSPSSTVTTGYILNQSLPTGTHLQQQQQAMPQVLHSHQVPQNLSRAQQATHQAASNQGLSYSTQSMLLSNGSSSHPSQVMNPYRS